MVMPASFRASSIIRSRISTWARAAISGTTPPKGACSFTCERIRFDRIRREPSGETSTMAAEVSSQVVSNPRTRIVTMTSRLISGACPAFTIFIRLLAEARPAVLDEEWPSGEGSNRQDQP